MVADKRTILFQVIISEKLKIIRFLLFINIVNSIINTLTFNYYAVNGGFTTIHGGPEVIDTFAFRITFDRNMLEG